MGRALSPDAAGDAAAGFGALVAGLHEQRDQVGALRPELSFEDVRRRARWPRTPPRWRPPCWMAKGHRQRPAVLLYDPAGQDGWGGPLRIIVYIRADLDPEIAEDPLIGQVGWTWLTEALGQRTGGYAQPSGTVTTVVTEGFGQRNPSPRSPGSSCGRPGRRPAVPRLTPAAPPDRRSWMGTWPRGVTRSARRPACRRWPRA